MLQSNLKPKKSTGKSNLLLSNTMSEASFNNVTIKSVDRQNIPVIHPLSAKNNDKKSANFQPVVSQPMRPAAYHSKNASLGAASFSSANSRFTLTRPKNPTTDLSVSSKGSLDSIGIAAPLGRFKAQPLNATIQTVKVSIDDNSASPAKRTSMFP